MGKEEKDWEKNAVNKQTNKSEQNKNGRIFNLFSGRKKAACTQEEWKKSQEIFKKSIEASV